jgi:hypothetical protein
MYARYGTPLGPTSIENAPTRGRESALPDVFKNPATQRTPIATTASLLIWKRAGTGVLSDM